jgi:chemotaxis methyl-accepting protein methylase
MDEQISQVAEAIARRTGIVVRDYHLPMLEYELAKLTQGGDVHRGASLVLKGNTAACQKLISVISNSETYLFRHWGHFEALRHCAERRLSAGRPFSVLSAGCSSGEECWSAAAVVGRVYLSSGFDNFYVVGWDLDPERLSRARSGVYSAWAIRNGLHGYDSFFEAAENRWRVRDTLRRHVDFKAVNLMEADWPCSGRFDAILFRNVSIYWEREKASSVKDRLIEILVDDGIMLLGPSDHVEFDSRQWFLETGSGAPVLRRLPSGSSPPQRRTAKKEKVRAHPERDLHPRPATPIKVPKFPNEAPHREAPQRVKPRPSLDDIEELANKGQYETALEALLNFGPNLPPAQKLWEGILLMNLDRVHDAIKVFRHCVFLEPEDPTYRHWLAVALDSAGHKIEAARQYRNARNIEVES